MTNPDYTAILFVIDRSGSMAFIKDDMEGGLKEFLREQSEIEGKATVDFAYFDYEFTYEESMLPITAAAPKIVPRGSTALHDAIVRASTQFGETLENLDESERPGKVLVVVVTDGHENASQENTAADVKKVIERQQNEFAWEYVFLGANQDAVVTASHFGIRMGSALTYDATSDGIAMASAGLSGYTRSFRAGETATFVGSEGK